LCLRLALDHPELVKALVLVSASPGITDADARRERITADEALAQMVERDGIDAFLTHWLAQPLFASVPPGAPGLAERRTLSPDYVAHCLRVLGTGTMEPMWDQLTQLQMPVALVTGTEDAKFDRLARLMLERLRGEAVHIRLEGGHSLPLEQAAVLGGFIAAFAAEHG
jgi:2-succinyl-6-hydroxy-2,4-cyclohexadiene-1-carboxylate synthase